MHPVKGFTEQMPHTNIPPAVSSRVGRQAQLPPPPLSCTGGTPCDQDVGSITQKTNMPIVAKQVQISEQHAAAAHYAGPVGTRLVLLQQGASGWKIVGASERVTYASQTVPLQGCGGCCEPGKYLLTVDSRQMTQPGSFVVYTQRNVSCSTSSADKAVAGGFDLRRSMHGLEWSDILAIVLGGVLAMMLVVMLLVFFKQRNRRQRQKLGAASNMEMTGADGVWAKGAPNGVAGQDEELVLTSTKGGKGLTKYNHWEGESIDVDPLPTPGWVTSIDRDLPDLPNKIDRKQEIPANFNNTIPVPAVANLIPPMTPPPTGSFDYFVTPSTQAADTAIPQTQRTPILGETSPHQPKRGLPSLSVSSDSFATNTLHSRSADKSMIKHMFGRASGGSIRKKTSKDVLSDFDEILNMNVSGEDRKSDFSEVDHAIAMAAREQAQRRRSSADSPGSVLSAAGIAMPRNMGALRNELVGGGPQMEKKSVPGGIKRSNSLPDVTNADGTPHESEEVVQAQLEVLLNPSARKGKKTKKAKRLDKYKTISGPAFFSEDESDQGVVGRSSSFTHFKHSLQGSMDRIKPMKLLRQRASSGDPKSNSHQDMHTSQEHFPVSPKTGSLGSGSLMSLSMSRGGAL